MWFAYVEPQETGQRTDVRWAAFTDAKGFGLRAIGLPLFEMSACPFRQADLEGVAHPYDIPQRDTVTVSLDLHQMGVGGDDSWGARTHEQYTLPSNRTYTHKLRLEPTGPAAGPDRAPIGNTP